MPQAKLILSNDQRAQIYASFLLSNAEFLEACQSALGFEDDRRAQGQASLYEKLASRRWTKLQALDALLLQAGYSALLDDSFSNVSHQKQFDIDALLEFATGDDARFVSMIVDFVANRSPTHDEALQFEQLLRTQKWTRWEVLEELLKRYPGQFEIVSNGQLIALPLSEITLLDGSKDAQFELFSGGSIEGEVAQGRVMPNRDTGGLFSSTLDLQDKGGWVLEYDIEGSADCVLEIAVHQPENGELLCKATASGNLVGQQQFRLSGTSKGVHILLKSLVGSHVADPRIELRLIRLKQVPSA